MGKSTMAKKPSPTLKMDRKQPTNKERSNDADRSGMDRRARDRRTGEGSQSALATMKNIERDRQRTKPDEGSSGN
jgi:hypothetical protein